MRKKLTFFVFLFSIALTFPRFVSAHPVDEIGNVNVYDQKQILTLSTRKALLKIDLTFYAFEKMEVWGSINTDADQNLTQKEKDRWMNMGSDASWLEVSGKKYLFKPSSVIIPNYDEFFSSKPVDISIEFTSNLKIKPGDTIAYNYSGKDKKLNEITLEVKGTDGIKVEGVEANSTDSVTFKILEGPQEEAQTFGVNASDRLNQFLEKYVKVDKVSTGLLLTALIISYLIGMLHALTPGHGKAIVAGYLVGERGSLSSAVQLGIIITITHTFSVFILGIVTLLLTQFIVPSQVIKWMSLVSGFLVAGFGLYLLLKRLKNIKKPNLTHDHLHTLSHSHHPHSHSHEAEHHVHEEMEISWKNLLPLGISGGIVPCVDALAILVVAVSLGKIVFGLILLVVFSVGLASALIIGGIIVVYAKNKALKRVSALEKYEKYSSIVSAGIVTILGIAIILGKPL